MKKIFNISFALSILISTLTFTSCEKDEGKLPNIAFKTGGSYTSSDVTLSKGQSFTIGIDASKAEDKDVLKTFDASKALNGGSASTIYNETLSGSSADNYSKDLTLTADTTASSSKYTFTVVNRDGLVNSVSLTVTVK
ncbi:MAG: hypothetical protein HYZ42_12190 [Bacteroidetes bacterium]|nr:hypothetical protein [Bacteroidota bacterium]